jgi:endoglucanase
VYNHSPSQPLDSLWQSYKQQNWDSDSGRTIDHQSNDATTSEGQSYTMLRAVWQNDRPTFDKTWNWTAKNLQRNDKLFSWRWGTRADGSMGILTDQGGQNTASDADSDIVLALLLADARWHTSTYQSAARAIIPAIWNEEVVTINGKPYLAADNLEKSGGGPVVVNVSYFSPYAYRIFGKIDSAHDWQSLVTNSYAIIHDASQAQLGASSSANLLPDWVAVDRQTGSLQPASGKDTDFGFDAFRTVWRVALDWQWFHDATAKQTLASFSSLTDFWDHSHKLFAIYSHSGQPAVNYTSLALYGGTLGYFQVIHPDTAKTIYDSELAGSSKQTLNYYDNNWVWFGSALYLNQLSNFGLGDTSS